MLPLKISIYYPDITDMFCWGLTVQYYLAQREWKIKHLTDALVVISASKKFQEALLTTIIFYAGDLLWTKWNFTVCSIFRLFSTNHSHLFQAQTFTELDMYKVTMFWISSSWFIKCFQFGLGTVSLNRFFLRGLSFYIHYCVLLIFRDG